MTNNNIVGAIAGLVLLGVLAIVTLDNRPPLGGHPAPTRQVMVEVGSQTTEQADATASFLTNCQTADQGRSIESCACLLDYSVNNYGWDRTIELTHELERSGSLNDGLVVSNQCGGSH